MIEEARQEQAEQRKALAAPQGGDGSKALALRPDQDFWNPKQIAALNALGIKGVGNADLAVFQHYCLKTRLDPFTRQIYFIKRRSKHEGQWVEQWTIQVGIDGYRVIAQRAARHEGVQIEYEDTVWVDERGDEHKVWLSATEQPTAAKVTVIKRLPDGTKLRYPAVARFEAYAAYAKTRDGDRYLTGQWPTMGDHMIEKCAEAFALRRAFPHDLSGVYTEEELQNVDYSAPSGKVQHVPAQEPPGDWTVQGSVMPDETAAGQEEPDTGQEEPAEGVAGTAEQKTALNRLMKVFREFGMGGRDQGGQRSAVITGLLAPAAGPSELIDVRKLSAQVLDHANDQLMAFLAKAEEDGKDPAESLDLFGQAVFEKIRERVG